jgi:hypothetical protein
MVAMRLEFHGHEIGDRKGAQAAFWKFLATIIRISVVDP